MNKIKYSFLTLILISFLLPSCAATPAREEPMSPSPDAWDPRNNTPGINISIKEVSRVSYPKGEVTYRLYGSNLPQDKKYSLEMKLIAYYSIN